MNFTWSNAGFCHVLFNCWILFRHLVKEDVNQLYLFKLSYGIQGSILFGTNLAPLLRHDSVESIPSPMLQNIYTLSRGDILMENTKVRGMKIACQAAFSHSFLALGSFSGSHIGKYSAKNPRRDLYDFWKTLSPLVNSATQILATSASPTSNLVCINSVSLPNCCLDCPLFTEASNCL